MRLTKALLITTAIVSMGTAANAQLQDQSVCEGDSVLLDAGADFLSYTWSTGQTDQAIYVSDAGLYIVTVFNGEVDLADSSDVVVLPAPEPVKGDTMVCAGEILTINPGSYDAYLWGEVAGFSTEPTMEVPAVTDWVLDLEVWNTFGCSLKDTIYVLASQAMELALDSSKTLCYGQADAWASVAVISGGIAPFSYLWGNGGTTDTITGISSQAYSIQVTDAAGCQALEDLLVVEGPAAALDVDTWTYDAVCMGSNGSAVAAGIDGTAPYTYDWETGAQTTDSAFGLTPGLHNLTVTDANGCEAASTVLVANENESINLTGSVSNSACGFANGQATVTPSGGYPGYSYLWANSSTTQTISGIVAGFYSVTVTDSLGCMDHYTLVVSDDEGPYITIDSADQSVCSQADGAIYVSTTGGTEPFTYGWSNGGTKEDLTKVGPGQYFLEIIDANGCKGNIYQTIGTDGYTAPKIAGTLTSSLNDSLIKSAKVTVIQNLNVSGVLPKFTSVNVGSDGVYVFESMIVGEYFLYVSPDTSAYPASFKTFYPNASRWNQAQSLSATCEDSVVANVVVTQKFILNGKAKITGKITQQTKGETNKTQGDPIPGIDVSLEQTPGGVVAQTSTDDEGIYTFDNVPPGNYQIFVDIPGLPMDSTYTISVPETQEDTAIIALDFLVDSTESVYIEPVSSGIFTVNASKISVDLFPNPSHGVATLSYELKSSELVNIDVMDVTGRTLKSIVSNATQHPGVYRYTLNLGGSSSGVQLVRISTGSSQQVLPIFIAQ